MMEPKPCSLRQALHVIIKRQTRQIRREHARYGDLLPGPMSNSDISMLDTLKMG